MLLFLTAAALEVWSTTSNTPGWEDKHFAALLQTKTATENTRQSNTKPYRLIHVTMLIELHLLKCLWILLDEVSYAQLNVTSMDVGFFLFGMIPNYFDSAMVI